MNVELQTAAMSVHQTAHWCCRVSRSRTKCTPRQIYHVSLMPCYDKKLEGARDDFASPYRNADSDDDEVNLLKFVLRQLSDR